MTGTHLPTRPAPLAQPYGSAGPTASLAEREALAREIRRLAAAAVGADLDRDTVVGLTESLRGTNDQLPEGRGSWPWYWELDPETRDGSAGWERFNPITPPMRIIRDAEEHQPRAVVRLDLPYTGPVGSVHGGYVAALLDHALGMYLRNIERSSVTTSLTVEYRAKTPLYVDLEVYIGHREVDDRRTSAWAEIRHRGVVTARADGDFLIVHSPSIRPTKATA